MKMKANQVFSYAVLSFGAALILIPFYLSIASSLKSQPELSRNFFGAPEAFNLENFRAILGKGDFYPALVNSFGITAVCLSMFIILLPMAAYPISRRMGNSRFYAFLYYYMLAGIFVPFQVKMIPIVKMMNSLGIANKFGLVLLYLAGGTCEGIFLITGYLASVPDDMEEAACIDGASTLYIFIKIMMPIMKPILSTITIKNCLWIWNDFMMPNMILRMRADRTLPLFQYAFQGEYATNYPMVFASFVMSMIPMMIFYLILQKHIIGGMMVGAVKG